MKNQLTQGDQIVKSNIIMTINNKTETFMKKKMQHEKQLKNNLFLTLINFYNFN